MIALDRCVFQPVVTKIGGSQLDVGGIGVAIDQIGAEEAAEKEGTPLNSLYSRLALDANDVAGIGPSGAAGTGDDIAEFSGRQCYRSWNAGRGPEDYIGNVIEEGHGSVFEHAQVIFQVTGVSRSLTHELIRHSIGIGYSQESQRYVDAKDMMFVVPPMVCNHLKANTHMSEAEMEVDLVLGQFRRSCRLALDAYVEAQDMYREILSAQGLTGRLLKKRVNEAARYALPNASETRLVTSLNLRAIRHVLTLRGTEHADLEIRRYADMLLLAARPYAPFFFADIEAFTDNDGLTSIRANRGSKI